MASEVPGVKLGRPDYQFRLARKEPTMFRESNTSWAAWFGRVKTGGQAHRDNLPSVFGIGRLLEGR